MNDIEVMPLLAALYQQYEGELPFWTSFQIDDRQ
jgi:hypothetical protein